MDLTTGVFLALVAVLAVNQALARIEAVLSLRPVYLSVQAINVGLGLGILVFGLPGWDHAPVVSWVVGPLFLVHVATNYRRRGLLVRALEKERDQAEQQAKRATIAQALGSRTDDA